MPEVTRHGPKDMRGVSFYDLDQLHVGAFCPDSNDASTPATQVHLTIELKPHPLEAKPHPMVMRFHRPAMLDALIDALIEHRAYVFGQREYRSDWPEQEES